MDINDFKKQEAPAQRRSRLLPYIREIAALRDEGYTNEQIGKWLKANGVTISSEGVRYFVKHHVTNQAVEEAPAAETPRPTARPPTRPASGSSGTATSTPHRPERQVSTPTAKGNPLGIKKRDFDLSDFDDKE